MTGLYKISVLGWNIEIQLPPTIQFLPTYCLHLTLPRCVKHAAVISLEHEELMWQKGALGVHSPDSLLRAVFYTVGLHFCLREGQEHRDSKRSQFTRIPTDGYDS